MFCFPLFVLHEAANEKKSGYSNTSFGEGGCSCVLAFNSYCCDGVAGGNHGLCSLALIAERDVCIVYCVEIAGTWPIREE